MGMWVPPVEMLKQAFDDFGIVNEGDDAQGGTAVDALQRVHFVDFPNEPRPGSLAPVVGNTFNRTGLELDPAGSIRREPTRLNSAPAGHQARPSRSETAYSQFEWQGG